jgi:branched-chain amino acid transport system ATP-binding protein
MTVLLGLEDLRVHFGGVKAVDGVTLSVEQGGLFGLVGPNGSGKSTILGAISRLTPLTSGKLVYDGHEYQGRSASAAARMGIGRTFQTVRLLPNLTILENVMLGPNASAFGQSIMKNWLLPWRTRHCEKLARDAAERAIDRLELGGTERLYPTALPYGTQRRVEIARALASDPRVLLLDEPTAGMNREERDEIGALLQLLAKQGLTQLLVEHDVPMITQVCSHIFVMNFGKLIAEGEPRGVVQLPEVQEAYLGKKVHSGAA